MLTSLPLHWFNQTISTQRVARTVDSGGSPIMSYTGSYLSGVIARVVDKSTTEVTSPGRVNSVGHVSVYVDGAPDIIETDRALWTDGGGTQRIFDIQAVTNPDKANVYLRLDCVEVRP